jgi:AraC-like DNA-binding protein
MLCGLTGMSRSRLYRCFAPLGGVARAIQAERLRRVHDELARSDGIASIARISQANGFASASTMTRTFRRVYGLTPNDVLARNAVAVAVDRLEAGSRRRRARAGSY